MEIKITKRKKLLEINNEMCHNFYYLVHGRFYNDDKTAYRKFHFVLWFDIFDVDEYFNYVDFDDGCQWIDRPITKNMIDEYCEEIIWSTVSMVSDNLIIEKIAENYIDEAFSTYGAQKILVAEHLGISVSELNFLSKYIGIDSRVWE